MLWASTGSPPEPPPLAVVCVGPDAAAAARFQPLLEAALAREGIAARRVQPFSEQEISSQLSMEAERNQKLRGEMRRALADAAQACYKDELGVASTYLDRVDELQAEITDLRESERVEGLLWRAALHHAQGNATETERLALEAWRLNNDLEVDRMVFRPSFADLVEQARPPHLERHRLQVVTSPESARLRVDGCAVERQTEVVAGPHRLEVTAPGYVGVEREVEVDGPRELRVTLSPVDAARQPFIDAVADPSHAQDVLSITARRAGTPAALAVVIDGDVARAMLYASGMHHPLPAVTADEAGARETASLVREMLFARQRYTARVSLAYGSRQLRVEGDGEYAIALDGVGPRLELDWQHSLFNATAELQWLAYPFGAPVAYANGNRRDLDGGWSTSGQLAAGIRGQWGPVALGVMAGVAGCHRTAVTLVENGADLTVVPAVDSIGPLLIASATAVLPIDAIRFIVAVRGGIMPWYLRAESKEHGSPTDRPPAYRWRVAVAAGEPWTVVVEYGGSWLDVHYSGEATIPTVVPVVGATLHQVEHFASVGVERQF